MKSYSKLGVVFLLVLTVVLSACGSNALQQIVDQSNAEIEAMSDDLAGIFKVHCEARGTGSLVVVFQAEDVIFEDPDMLRTMADIVAPIYSTLPADMREMNIQNPKVIVEFLDTGGVLIYSREFT